jgi:hypothetical protein
MLDTTYLLWYSSIVVQFLFCLYLVWTRLAKSYPVFTIYLAVSVLSSLCGIYFMRGANGPRLPLVYTYYWLCAQPVILLAQIAVTLEVHAGMWRGHEAVVRQTRPLLLFALLTALVSAGIPVRAELLRAGSSHLIAVMQFGFLVTRYVSSVLAIFLVLSATLFLIAVHNGTRSSLFRHEGMLAAYFGIYAVATLLAGMGWVRTTLVNGYLASLLTLCFVAWFSVLKPQLVPNE